MPNIDIAKFQFTRDYIVKTLKQEKQFEQWLKITFYLNSKLQEEYDSIYQVAFYVKLYEVLTEGLNYAVKVYEALKKGNNLIKRQWYSTLIEGLNKIKSNLDETEFLYIEYRRHSSSHIFQNQYEHIQNDLRIKKHRKDKNLKEINDRIKSLILKHGSDRKIDDYLNNKLQLNIMKIYEDLIAIHQNS
ncbi:hypothetical protein JXQ31_00630 [candidate division KSB1 bacterium]|nr:hypothetical protein [candidate division KSB1 bacterium]